MWRNCLIIICFSSSFSIKTPPEEDYYYGAVVEYSPIEGKDNLDSIMKNVKEYVLLIQNASKEADIIVFPEEGLFYYDNYSTFIEVPFPSTVPENLHPALKELSQAAQENNVYVVVNLHEKYESAGTTYHYNTNVVFDRLGHIIARYRKTHLFNEPLNITNTPEVMYFDSDFGVRFGTFICFDMLFKEPTLRLVKEKNVTDILYPTWWFSGLPFFTAVQTQAAWAYSTDTNLLAAGGNNVLNANTGSGIYSGKKGPVIYLQSQRNMTCILSGKIFKKNKEGFSTGKISSCHRYGEREHLKIWSDPVLQQMESIPITPQPLSGAIFSQDMSRMFNNTSPVHLKKQICHHEFCCIFDLNVTFNNELELEHEVRKTLIYRLVVFSGVQLYYVIPAGVQICAIISCLNQSLDSCSSPFVNSYKPSVIFHSVSIKTKNIAGDSITFPDILEISENVDVFGSLMDPKHFSFNSNNAMAELNFSSNNLITAALYTRVFSRDDTSDSSSNIYISTLIIFISSSLILYIFTNP